jgi:phosphoribosylanthranilate isomerase
MPEIRVKICGLKTLADVADVAASGAAYAGFVFFAKSPRNLTIPTARELALATPLGLAKVALVVDAEDAFLDEITEAMPLDMLQLHGHESPDRVAEIRARYGLPVMKAVGVADEPFEVRHYTGCERPELKGNGFDGLALGEDREDAEEFTAWINARLRGTARSIKSFGTAVALRSAACNSQ